MEGTDGKRPAIRLPIGLAGLEVDVILLDDQGTEAMRFERAVLVGCTVEPVADHCEVQTLQMRARGESPRKYVVAHGWRIDATFRATEMAAAGPVATLGREVKDAVDRVDRAVEGEKP